MLFSTRIEMFANNIMEVIYIFERWDTERVKHILREKVIV